MKTFLSWIVLSIAGSLLWGCNTGIYADPEGLQCDVGSVCPNGYFCGAGNTCRASNGAGGGDASGGGSAAGGPGGASGGGQGMDGGSGGSGGGAGGGNPCAGMNCVTPPVPGCKDGKTLTTFSATGTCNNGQCSYTSMETPCANGCSRDICQNQNLCAGNTCMSPPPPTCMGMLVRTFMAPGTCNAGTGTCTYNPIDTSCVNGCAGGVCVTPAQTMSQTMPRLKFAVNSVDQAPNSSGSHVLVVGDKGNIAKWDGTAFANVPSPSVVTSNLNHVWFAGANAAIAVGSERTVIRYNGTSYSGVSGFPGTSPINFTAVHGRDESSFSVIDGSENFWRFDSSGVLGNWTTGSVSKSVLNSYKNNALYVDAQNRLRIAGVRTVIASNVTNGIVHFFDTGTCLTGCDDIDGLSGDGFSAVGGPALDGGSVMPTVAWAGRASSSGLRHHSATGSLFFSTSAFALPPSKGVIAITSQPINPRQAYFLTRTAGSVGYLYRYSTAGAGSLDPEPLAEFYFDRVSMSRNESGGVIVAETDVTNGVNNIYRRNSAASEMLDLGENWTAVSSNAGALVLASAVGDFAVRTMGAKTWQFRRAPFVAVTDIAAGNGTHVLVAGKAGKLARFQFGALNGTNIPIASATANDFNAICRISDSEAYAVGNLGIARSVNTIVATAAVMTSGTSKNLLSVDCLTPGVAYACGQGGTVLQLNGGLWSPLTPAFPNPSIDIASCKRLGSVLWAAGDNAFYKIDLSAAAPTWQQLPIQSRLSRLNVISASDVYALSGSSSVVRFDGAAWSTLFTVTSGTLVGGGQVGGKVVYAGSLGAVVEGR